MKLKFPGANFGSKRLHRDHSQVQIQFSWGDLTLEGDAQHLADGKLPETSEAIDEELLVPQRSDPRPHEPIHL
jgi:hypothetical protein